MTNSTISNNRSSDDGGGIHAGVVTIVNSTISGNRASPSGMGFNYSTGGGVHAGILTIRNSTVTGNRSDEGGAGIDAATSITMSNSIVTANHSNFGIPVDDVGGSVVANFSLIGNVDPTSVDGEGNLIGVDPMLGPLADNGGPTLTHALLPGSPAIDAGDPNFDPNDPDGDPDTDDAIPFDQRGEGFPRVVGGRVDMGAYESHELTPAIAISKTPDVEAVGQIVNYTLIVTNAGNVSLTNVDVSDPTADAPPAFVVGDVDQDGELDVDETWEYSASYTVTQSDFEEASTIVNEASVTALGFVEASTSATVSVAQVWALTVTSEPNVDSESAVGELITYAYTLRNVGNQPLTAISVSDPALAAPPLLVGGDLDDDERLDLGESWTLAGVRAVTQADLDAGEVSSTVAAQSAESSPASATAIVTVDNSTIANNQSGRSGGGLYVEGDLVVTNSTISGNQANESGGGVYVDESGSATVSHSTVVNNDADVSGGGLFGGDVSFDNVLIADNSAPVGPDGFGNVSANYSLFGESRGANITGTNNLTDVDPMLGPLADNGGFLLPDGTTIQTHALLEGSPAIDAGDPGFTLPPEFDQRGEGYPRVVDGRVDIGAFEVQNPPAVNALREGSLAAVTPSTPINVSTLRFGPSFFGSPVRREREAYQAPQRAELNDLALEQFAHDVHTVDSFAIAPFEHEPRDWFDESGRDEDAVQTRAVADLTDHWDEFSGD